MALRRSPIRKKRLKPRRGEPSKDEKGRLHEHIYQVSGGRCELKFQGQKLPGCNQRVLPPDGDPLWKWHLVHVRAKRRFGWPIEGPKRMQGGCYHCHIENMHQKGMKPDDATDAHR